MTTCPAVLRLRKQLPSLVLSEQTRLIARHIQCHEIIQLDRFESIALATCLRFWKERKHVGPCPDPEALALVTGEGMRNAYNARLQKDRLVELANIARHLSTSTYAQSYYPGGIQPQLVG